VGKSPPAAAAAAPVTCAIPAGPYGAAAVLADVAAGAEPLPFKRIARLACLKREGRSRHVGFVYRATDPANPHPLESAVICGVRVSTEAAVFRWLARNIGTPAGPSAWTPTAARREHERAVKSLRAAGLEVA